MPKTMAVTHEDLAPSRKETDLESKFGVSVIVSTILCGFACFVLCLVAEATRSEMTWIDVENKAYECVYSGSGKVSLLCATSAFAGLAVAIMIEHGFMLVSITKLPPSALLYFDSYSGCSKTLTFQAGFFFVSTWVCFAVGEIMLLIGISMESGHLKDWPTPRPSCLVTRQGLFSSAGVFGLVSVFLAAGLYLTALRAHRLFQAHENVRVQILEASALYASPPRSPMGHRISAVARENPVARDENDHQETSFEFSNLAYSKDPSLV